MLCGPHVRRRYITRQVGRLIGWDKIRTRGRRVIPHTRLIRPRPSPEQHLVGTGQHEPDEARWSQTLVSEEFDILAIYLVPGRPPPPELHWALRNRRLFEPVSQPETGASLRIFRIRR